MDAYWNAQQGEKAEHSNNLKQALGKFREAARLLEVVSTKYPSWSPQIVEYRKKLTAESIVRVQEKLGHVGGESPAPVEPGLPRSGDNQFNDPPSEIPRIAPDNDQPLPGDAGRSRKGRPKAPAADEGSGSVLENVKRLQDDLQRAREEVKRLQDENASIVAKLDEAAKARFTIEKQEEILQKRAELAETKLREETNSNHASAEKVAVLTKELTDSRKALSTMKIEAEADREYRRQLEERYKSQFNRIADLTKQRDEAKALSEGAPGKIDAAEKRLAAAIKEKQDLAVKLQTTQTQLQEVTTQRDDAMAQVTKLKEAQKQVDKLVADNTALMAKLSDAQKSIAEFKTEGLDKDKQIDALKREVGSVRAQLDSAKKESADYQKKMGDLQAKLDDTAKQLATAKAENTETAAEKKKMQDENQVLRSIVLRQQKKEAERMAMKKVVIGELSKLEINSKSLLKQIDFLSEPIVRLTPKERALFKKAELQVSDTEISMFISQSEEPAKANTSADPAGNAAPAATPKASEPVVALATPAAKPAPAPAPQATPVAATPAPEAIAQATPAPAPKPQETAAAQPTPSTPAVAAKATPKPKKGEKLAKAATPSPTPAAATPQPTQLAKNDEANKPGLSLNQNPAPDLPTNSTPTALFPETSAPMNPPKPSAPEQTAPPASTQNEAAQSMSQGNVPNVPTELVPLAKEGKELFDRGKYVEAEKTYQKILQKAPRNLYALSNLGVVLFRSGKFKMAEEAFNKAIAVAPEDGFSHCTLGIVCYSEQKLDDAVNELTKALAINPKNATAHNYLGITASQKGWPEAAQKELETAVSLDPSYADAYFNLSVVFATQNPPNKEQARKQYKRAIELGAEADSALEQLIK